MSAAAKPARPGRLGAFHELIPIRLIAEDGSFSTKDGRAGICLRLHARDSACLDGDERDRTARRFEAALGDVSDGASVQAHLIKSPARMPACEPAGDAEARRAVERRTAHLDSKNLHEARLFLTVLSGRRSLRPVRFAADPRAALAEAMRPGRARRRLLAESGRAAARLRTRVEAFCVRTADVLPSRILDREGTFAFLRSLANPGETDPPAAGTRGPWDRRLCGATLRAGADLLTLGRRRLSVLSLKDLPAATFADFTSPFLDLPCPFVLSVRWKAEPTGRTRRRIDSRRRHFHNSRRSLTSLLSREEPAPDDALLDPGATALADDLGDALRAIEVEGRRFGAFSLVLALHHRDAPTIRRAAAEANRLLSLHGGSLIEETYNLLPAYLSILPGNGRFDHRRLWLSDRSAADLLPLFLPASGEKRNEHLGAESLAVLENRGFPYHLNLHADDVAHTLVMGATGSGKSFLLDFLITHLQKYRPRTLIFDLGGGYRRTAERFGGGRWRAARARGALNPFSLAETDANRRFILSFLKVLASVGGLEIEGDEERDLEQRIGDLYGIDRSQRRLSTLVRIVRRPVARALAPWVEGGRHGDLFDSASDDLTMGRFRVFDFAGLEDRPEAIEPLLFYVLHRASAELASAERDGAFTVMLLDEAWRFLRHESVRAYVAEGMKTWRKRNAAVILATQSASDLREGGVLRTAVEACRTTVFLSDPGLDRERAQRLFGLTERQARLVADLIPRRQLLLKRPEGCVPLDLTVEAAALRMHSTGRAQAESRPDGRGVPDVLPEPYIDKIDKEESS